MTVLRHFRSGSPTGHRHRHRPWLSCRHCCGLALDLGSARTRAWIAGRGLILDVPTITFPGAGAVYPIQRGAIVDVPGTARLLDRLLSHRLPRLTRPLVVVTAPVLGGPAHRERARTAVEVLRPRAVLTVPTARAIALAADADLSLPLLVVDIGAHLTEVVLLLDGLVFDARRTALRPDLTHRLIGGTHAPLRAVPAPHTAAIRGAATFLRAAHGHPSASGTSPP
ncbi:rod shape-determining protein [Streptomyces sp. OE57]|uniref:rod shape-determining protein n=1 Tax=Streptomyces lacaronensis TaxID=3379885 RepID=UPI0039B74A72